MHARVILFTSLTLTVALGVALAAMRESRAPAPALVPLALEPAPWEPISSPLPATPRVAAEEFSANPAPGATEVAHSTPEALEERPALFRAVSPEAIRGPIVSLPKRTVIRERFVQVDAERFTPSFDPTSPGVQPRPKTLDFDLFDGLAFEVELDRLDAVSSRPSSLIWLGHVVGVENSAVTIVVRGEVVQGVVRMPTGEQYELQYAGDGVHRIVETDTTEFPIEAAPIDATQPESDDAALAPVVAAAPAQDLTVIDVMVVYTPAARDAAGGVDAIEARIEQGISRANQAYQNSEVAQAHRLVHMAMVDYVEETRYAFVTAINQLNFDGDRILDGVHDPRDAHHADIVSLVIDDSTWCGIAAVGNPTLPGADYSGFNVNYWACVGSIQTLAHEIGHNQGLVHDWDNSYSPGVFPYSYGLQDPGYFHTVMAYDYRYGCTWPCPRIDHFSNPGVLYDGRPTGIPGEADTARSLNQTRHLVAAWRQDPNSVVPEPDADGDGVSDSLDNCAEIPNLGQADTNQDGVGDACEADSDDDGVSDFQDNCAADPNPDQRDVNLDGFGDACDADYDGDLLVNNADLQIFRNTFLRKAGDAGFYAAADHNGDGRVNFLDFMVLRMNFQQSPGPSGLACAGTEPCEGP